MCLPKNIEDRILTAEDRRDLTDLFIHGIPKDLRKFLDQANFSLDDMLQVDQPMVNATGSGIHMDIYTKFWNNLTRKAATRAGKAKILPKGGREHTARSHTAPIGIETVLQYGAEFGTDMSQPALKPH